MNHIPVFLDEVVRVLNPQSGGRYIDATLGDGGHAQALLQHSSPDGRLLGIDQDSRQIAQARTLLTPFGERATLVEARFSQMQSVAQKHGFDQVDGILFDLGISSRQLDDPRYGLTFRDEAPLDMRLSSEGEFTAADLLNHRNEREIADILYLYGDRHDSRSLARKIVAYRKKQAFETAHDLKQALDRSTPGYLAPIFQALRIAVNQEYTQIEAALPQALELLKPGGVLAVISFHSGEDRLVKQFFKTHAAVFRDSKKITAPSREEQQVNSRSRSAKLRYATKH
jgi:16S rRNA (cytosine1402-N4)-methyltransferase